MRCFECRTDITKIDMKKAVVEYQQSDGSIKAYGHDRPDGKPSWLGGTPTGKLLHAYHYKCYMSRLRAQERQTLGHITNLTAGAHTVNVKTRDSIQEEATKAQEATLKAREEESVHPAQPLYYEGDPSDWRDETTLEVGDLLVLPEPAHDVTVHDSTNTGADSATG